MVRAPLAILNLAELLPLFRKAQQFGGRHFDNRETLPALRDERFVDRTRDTKRAPEAHALDAIEPAVYDETITEFRRAAVIDFGADNDRVFLFLAHLDELQAEL